MKIKKILALFICVLIALGTAGCTVKQKAEKTVVGMLESLKSGNIEETAKYINVYELTNWGSEKSDKTATDEKPDEYTEDLLKPLFQKLSYKILEISKVDRNNVVVKTEITNIDMNPIMDTFMNEMIDKELGNSFASENEQISDEEMQKWAKERLLGLITHEGNATATNTVDIKVSKTDKGWKVVPEDSLKNSIWGGLYNWINQFNSSTSNGSK